MKRLMLIGTCALALLLTGCGDDYVDEEPSGNTPTQGGFSTFTSPQGVQVECRDFSGNTECWVVPNP